MYPKIAGVVIRKFGEDLSKIMPVGLFFPTKFPYCGHNYLSKQPHLLKT